MQLQIQAALEVRDSDLKSAPSFVYTELTAGTSPHEGRDNNIYLQGTSQTFQSTKCYHKQTENQK